MNKNTAEDEAALVLSRRQATESFEKPASEGAASALAVVIPALNESANLEFLLPALTSVLNESGIDAEVVVVDGGSRDNTVETARALGARVVHQRLRGYGAALMEGLAAVKTAAFVATMDADLSHRPVFLRDLWAVREDADLVVASRYVPGGGSKASLIRQALSRILNAVFGRVLSVPVRDLSSGYRLYRRQTLESLSATSVNFAVLPEILVRLYAEGYRVVEVPFQYATRLVGTSHARFVRFFWDYLKTLWHLWQLRNSVASADYDHRAFDSAIRLQRYWQRSRHRIILDFVGTEGQILDVGCGSSRILRDLSRAIGVDVLLRKLRFMRPAHPQVVQASVFALPFSDRAFDTVICSEVIEHVPDDPRVLGELTRVLRDGGILVLGTPDYGRALWHVIEWAYGKVTSGGYAEEHITHFDRSGLEARLASLGYTLLDCRYVGACEMIFKARKKETTEVVPSSSA